MTTYTSFGTATVVPRTMADPELALLVLCARPRACVPDVNALAKAAARVTDWERFYALARYHALIPLTDALHRKQPFLPEAVADSVARAARANAVRCLRHSVALVRMIEELERRGIPAMALKGPALGAEAYGDPCLRSFDDLDVLIHREHLSAALEALFALGYETILPSDARNAQHPPWSIKDISLRHDHTRVVLELHWRLAASKVDFRFVMREVFARAERVQLLGREVLVPGHLDQFLYLLVNATSHGWSKLERVSSLGEIVARCADVDLADYFRHAEQHGVWRRMVIAILLTDILGVRWPKTIMREALADTQATRLAHHARDSWGLMYRRTPGDLPATRLLMQSLDTPMARAQFAAKLVLEPEKVDWATIHLPRSFHRLYYLLRPARLIIQHAKRCMPRAS